jgi:hypothetical protein
VLAETEKKDIMLGRNGNYLERAYFLDLQARYIPDEIRNVASKMFGNDGK